MTTKLPVIHLELLTRKHEFAFTPFQVFLAALLLGLGLPLLISTVEVSLLNTVLIFFFVLFAGLSLCRATQIKLDDPKLRLLGTFWLIKLVIIIFLLYLFWIPLLESSEARLAFDPLRYFYDAQDLIENGWSPVAGSNYQGIIFYYAVIFYLFGHNPIIPAMLNGFITLLATLFIIRVAYEFKGSRGPRDWVLAFLLLIPETLLYDVMTGRESLMAVLVLFSTVAAGRYIVNSSRVSLTSTIFIVCGCLIAILAVRTTMSIPVVVAIVLMSFVLRQRTAVGLPSKMVIIVIGVGLLTVGPLIQKMLGGSDFDFLTDLQKVQSFEDNLASQIGGWSDNSIGLLLAPSNIWTAIVFTPPRLLLYLVSPLPKIMVDNILILMVSLTSVLNLLVMPYVMAGFIRAWRSRSEFLVIYIAFLISFIAISGGNIIIHERYRVMVTLLLFTCSWFGYSTCSSKNVRYFAILWYSLLAFCAAFYIFYTMLGAR